MYMQIILTLLLSTDDEYVYEETFMPRKTLYLNCVHTRQGQMTNHAKAPQHINQDLQELRLTS